MDCCLRGVLGLLWLQTDVVTIVASGMDEFESGVLLLQSA